MLLRPSLGRLRVRAMLSPMRWFYFAAGFGVSLSLIEYLRSDVFRYRGNTGIKALGSFLLTQRTFRVIFTLRLCQKIAGAKCFWQWLLPVCQVLHRLSCQFAGVDISWRTSIGHGFALTHGWGVVINEDAIIGSNVTVFHGVTLGRRDRISADGVRSVSFPVIEDEVWIGPHAIIVGGVRIGFGSRIGGGAFVTEDVPPFSVVVGNPAQVVKTGAVPDVMNKVII